jgi:hypothetical protein
MRAELVELRLNIFRCHVAAVAGVAVVRGIGKIEQPRLRAGVMWCMAILACIRRNRRHGRVRPWINANAIPRLVGNSMRRILPADWPMTRHADCRGVVIANQKLSILIIMRVMARRALHLVIVVQPDFVRKRSRILQLPIGRDERIIIRERNRMVVRKVCAEIARAARHGRYSTLHLDCGRTRRDHSNSHSPIVTAQAKLRRSRWLANRRFRRRAAVRRIRHRRKRMIPKRRLPRPAMWRMAKVTDLRFHRCLDRAAACHRKIMFCREHRVRTGRKAPNTKRQAPEKLQTASGVGAWSLVFSWSLVFGAWDFHIGPTYLKT